MLGAVEAVRLLQEPWEVVVELGALSLLVQGAAEAQARDWAGPEGHFSGL